MYGIARIDASGRICERAIITALGLGQRRPADLHRRRGRDNRAPRPRRHGHPARQHLHHHPGAAAPPLRPGGQRPGTAWPRSQTRTPSPLTRSPPWPRPSCATATAPTRQRTSSAPWTRSSPSSPTPSATRSARSSHPRRRPGPDQRRTPATPPMPVEPDQKRTVEPLGIDKASNATDPPDHTTTRRA